MDSRYSAFCATVGSHTGLLNVCIRTDWTVMTKSSFLESLGQFAGQFRRWLLLAFLRSLFNSFARSVEVFAFRTRVCRSCFAKPHSASAVQCTFGIFYFSYFHHCSTKAKHPPYDNNNQVRRLTTYKYCAILIDWSVIMQKNEKTIDVRP